MVSEEEGLSQGDVCRRFEQDPSRITRLAQALEADGLVRRERDREDSRVVRLYLTDEGRELVSTFPGRHKAFERRVERAMSEGELRELRRLLGLLDAAMKD
jgi:DNA-binding MarR family transcriptional regulator